MGRAWLPPSKRTDKYHQSEVVENRQLFVASQLQVIDERIRRLNEKIATQQFYKEHNLQSHENYDEITKVIDDEIAKRQLEKDAIAIQLVKANLLENGKILNMYRWGSRWFGTGHKHSSDYDYLAICEGYNQPAENNVVEFGDVDVSMHSLSHFQGLLDQHVPWLLEFLSFPAIIKSIDLQFDFRLFKLLKALGLNTTVNLRQAKGFWKEGEIRKSKKRVYYVLQIMHFMIQVAQHGHITDHQEANQYYDPLMTTFFPSWDQFEGWFQPIYDKLMVTFKQIIGQYKIFEQSIQQSWNSISMNQNDATSLKRFYVVEYLKQYGMDALHRNLSIVYHQHPKFPQLYHLYFHPDETTGESFIGRECCGLIVESSGAGDWRVVSFPLQRIFSDDSNHAATIDWDSCQVTEKLDGHLAILYYYQNQWHVASKLTCDGSELFPSKSDNNNNHTDETFAGLFWNMWNRFGYSHPESYRNCCFVFELISTSHRMVMHYPNDRLVLVAVRRLCQRDGNLYEAPLLDPQAFQSNWQCNWDIIKPLNEPKLTADILKEKLKTVSNIAGFMISDSKGNFLKMYSTLYATLVEISQTQDTQTQELALLDLIAQHCASNPPTLFQYPFAESQQIFDRVQEQFESLCVWLDAEFQVITQEIKASPSHPQSMVQPTTSKKKKNVEREEKKKKAEEDLPAALFVPAAQSRGDIGAFLFWIREGCFQNAKECFAGLSVSPLFNDRKKLRKYLQVWWAKYHLSNAPRKFTYCYK